MTEPWSIAVTLPGQERHVSEYFERNGFAYHWFRERFRIVRKGRVVESIRPLFSRYIFVRAQGRFELLRERARIIGFVQFGHNPVAEVADRTVEEILLVTGPTGIAPVTEVTKAIFKRGQLVSVVGGPFLGYRGAFLRQISDDRSVIWVELFGRSVPVCVQTGNLVEYVATTKGNVPQKKWKQRRWKQRRNRFYDGRQEQVAAA